MTTAPRQVLIATRAMLATVVAYTGLALATNTSFAQEGDAEAAAAQPLPLEPAQPQPETQPSPQAHSAQYYGTQPYPEPPVDDDEVRSPGMMATGIVFTVLGGVNAALGVAVLVANADCSGDFCGFGTILGGGVTLLGVTFLGVGIPLWVVGSGDPEPETATANVTSTGALQLRPDGLALGGTF